MSHEIGSSSCTADVRVMVDVDGEGGESRPSNELIERINCTVIFFCFHTFGRKLIHAFHKKLNMNYAEHNATR